MKKASNRILRIMAWVSLATIHFGFAKEQQYPAVVETEKRALLSSEIQGVLGSIQIKSGQIAKKDQVLIVVEHDLLLLQKDKLNENLNFLKKKFNRVKSMFKKGLASGDDVERLELDLKTLELDLQMIEAQIEQAKIKAPFEGKVVQWHARPHEWIAVGKPVVEIINPNECVAVVNLPAHYLNTLELGAKANLLFQASQKEVVVELKYISSQVDVRSHTILTRWRIKESNSVLPGSRATISL